MRCDFVQNQLWVFRSKIKVFTWHSKIKPIFMKWTILLFSVQSRWWTWARTYVGAFKGTNWWQRYQRNDQRWTTILLFQLRVWYVVFLKDVNSPHLTFYDTFTKIIRYWNSCGFPDNSIFSKWYLQDKIILRFLRIFTKKVHCMKIWMQ